MNKYTAITFAPVQGFIEKSRKLRDLYGGSLILSYLSQQIVSYVKSPDNDLVLISPALPSVQKGMPNRILIKGEMSKEEAEKIILSAWKEMLRVCREWIETELPPPEFKYEWEREWSLWGCHTWEIFQGCGCCIEAAMNDLETKKLSRDWTAVNWIGESSSLTGTDGIAFPGLGSDYRNPKTLDYKYDDDQIKEFYTRLARKLDNCPDDKEPEGKFIAPNEKLSIPELVKRLVTLPEIADLISREKPKDKRLAKLKGFKEIDRKPTDTTPGQWTGWFMGDGDKVGEHLKKLALENNDGQSITEFSNAIRGWGQNFEKEFPKELGNIANSISIQDSSQDRLFPKKLGRIVYAGGDDFLGIIYNPIFQKKSHKQISGFVAYKWLLTLNDKWKEHGEKINVSVGFVWVAGSVPQRDVLQHCREAEKVAKSLDRNRVTIRVVFNSGQYVQWTCPWDNLGILMKYRDRDKQSNWSHIYQDLAHLESRRVFDIENANEAPIVKKTALEFFDLYFPGEGQKLITDVKYGKNINDKKNELAKKLVGFSDDSDEIDRSKAIVGWITDLVKVGWHLC
ncbi:type III-B CRISPR-associated protein Cas10/Cmr2 [Anabaena sp. UHCC 0451]|uniref:type III-B CRISPR-associated protein Cas10/Cmr2 n=1 Tax=Anabaena sp. UHCC 0451 TaxID=2055235 RepID=UPI002B217DFF|nr:type III-B CRISPR-associated protein Cas10/Cmr2 [Anabaena sp. UHCC 0451]MEA5575946.1 type III-B CRISPR-associated protein Cas10/Cmr2 [Anabaena sp. UHCC 0451]